jgi:hypothetical protein
MTNKENIVFKMLRSPLGLRKWWKKLGSFSIGTVGEQEFPDARQTVSVQGFR